MFGKNELNIIGKERNIIENTYIICFGDIILRTSFNSLRDRKKTFFRP